MFRGKQVNTKEWIYGSLLDYKGSSYIIPEDGDLLNFQQYEVDHNTICEKTGLYNLGIYDIYEHDYIKVPDQFGRYIGQSKYGDLYEVRKEYNCPGGCWSNSGFVLYGVDFDGFLSFEDTVMEDSNEITVEIVGNKFDGVVKK